MSLRARPIQIAVATLAVASLTWGVWLLVEARGCSELDCLAALFGGYLIGFGLLLLGSLLPNPFGFAAHTLLAVALTLMAIWVPVVWVLAAPIDVALYVRWRLRRSREGVRA